MLLEYLWFYRKIMGLDIYCKKWILHSNLERFISDVLFSELPAGLEPLHSSMERFIRRIVQSVCILLRTLHSNMERFMPVLSWSALLYLNSLHSNMERFVLFHTVFLISFHLLYIPTWRGSDAAYIIIMRLISRFLVKKHKKQENAAIITWTIRFRWSLRREEVQSKNPAQSILDIFFVFHIKKLIEKNLNYPRLSASDGFSTEVG